MLFIVNGVGVPSLARPMKFGPAHPADVTAEGIVDVLNLLAVIRGWGSTG